MPHKWQALVVGFLLWLGIGSNAFIAQPRPHKCSSRPILPHHCTPSTTARHGGPPPAPRHHCHNHNSEPIPFLGFPSSSSAPESTLFSNFNTLIPGSCFVLAIVALCLLDASPANADVGALVDVSLVKEIDVAGILQKAGRKAVGGGVSGAAASLVQLVTLMWLRTTMQYQYRYGLAFKETLEKLYKEGGIPRFYQGLSVAAFQLPLSRFGDVAANSFTLLALDSFESTRGLPLPLKSVFASIAAGAWRFVLMPLDAVKTTLQVEGPKGLPQIRMRLKEEGISSLYQGAVVQALATAVGHYPYFLTFNYLSSVLPMPPSDAVFPRLGRNAFLGLCSSTVSDVCSNCFRVIKTTKQTAETQITYQEALRQVLDKDGVKGLFGRGLRTRLAANALQGMLFSVVWRYLEESQILFGGK